MEQGNANHRKVTPPACEHEHSPAQAPGSWPILDSAQLERASRLFRALGDPARLRVLVMLNRGECCVTELVESLGEKFSTISQRLRILHTEGLIHRRRAGLHIYYKLADGHVAQLMANALEHAGELNAATPRGPTTTSTEDDE